MKNGDKKNAVILFNMGGPQNIEEVKVFLSNMFYDEDIIDLPTFLRFPISKLITFFRLEKSKKIYNKIGG